MLAGDVKLPFLSDGVFIPGDLGAADLSDFDRVFEAIQPLVDYVTPRSSGQIVCGTEVGPDPDGAGGVEGIPTGNLIELAANQPVFCRAYTSVDGSAQWQVGGTNVGAASTTTIGADPTANIELSADGDGDFAVSIEFTPGDGSGVRTILPRPETIQDLLIELADAGLIPTVAGNPDFDYLADAEAFTFPFDFAVAGPITRDATINAGNTLVAATGITGLAAGASASASYSLSDISAGVTLGLIVTDDVESIQPADNATNPPGPLDRFFLTDLDSLIEVGDVAVGGDIDMVGRLGFLEVSANVDGTLTSPGPDPALKVGLTSGSIPHGRCDDRRCDPGARRPEPRPGGPHHRRRQPAIRRLCVRERRRRRPRGIRRIRHRLEPRRSEPDHRQFRRRLPEHAAPLRWRSHTGRRTGRLPRQTRRCSPALRRSTCSPSPASSDRSSSTTTATSATSQPFCLRPS